MTENEAELLTELRALKETRPDGCAPMDVGGSDSSHHSVTLRRMVPKGWVEKRYRGGAWGAPRGRYGRCSCLYRITPKGEQALANHLALTRMAG